MRQLDSVPQAFMLVRSNMAAHGELIGMRDGWAYYAYNNGTTKTVIARNGARPEGTVVHRGTGIPPELVGMSPRNQQQASRRKRTA